MRGITRSKAAIPRVLVGAFLAAAPIAAPACASVLGTFELVDVEGSGDGASNATSGTGGTGGMGSTGGTGGMGSADGTGGTGGTGSTGSTGSTNSSSSGMAGACNNPSDLMKLKDDTATQKAMLECRQMCVLNPQQAMCAQQCMVMKRGLSDACGKCWGDRIACGLTMCFTECLPDPKGPTCTSCTSTKCDPAFHMCAGI